MKENKDIPLMEPTFFEDNDPNNPKYINKKEVLKKIEEELKKENKKGRIKVLLGALLGGALAILVGSSISYLGSSILDVEASSFNDFIVYLATISGGLGSFFGTVSLCVAKNEKKLKPLENKKIKLEEEIKEDELKEKVKCLSKENKKVLQKVIENPEVKDVLTDMFGEYENVEDSFVKDMVKVIYSDDENVVIEKVRDLPEKSIFENKIDFNKKRPVPERSIFENKIDLDEPVSSSKEKSLWKRYNIKRKND